MAAMQNMEQLLVSEFLTALGSSADFELVKQESNVEYRTAEGGRGELDAFVSVRPPGSTKEMELAVEAKRVMYPRDVRKVAEQLAAYAAVARATGTKSTTGVVVAEHLTEGAREALREAGLNYFDLSGTLYFRHGTWLIDIERPSKPALTRRVNTVFSGAREQVVHALLMQWWKTGGEEWVSGVELAQMAQTSGFTVSTTLQELEQNEWVESTGSGPTQRRRVFNPSGLLNAWAHAWRQRLHKERRTPWYGYAGKHGIVDLVLSGLAGQDDWALTGAAAANMVVPHLTAVDRAMVIVQPDSAEAWAKRLKLQPAEKGSNVVFVERSGAALQLCGERPEHPGARFASPFVQYLDLRDGVGRNQELATEFRRQVLKIEEKND